MLWAVMAYSLGIVAGVYLWRPALCWTVAVAAFILAAAYFVQRRSGLGWILALSAFFLAGALHINFAVPRRVSTPASNPTPIAKNSKSLPTSPATDASNKAASTKSDRPST